LVCCLCCILGTLEIMLQREVDFFVQHTLTLEIIGLKYPTDIFMHGA
jgi:hypothetical protein